MLNLLSKNLLVNQKWRPKKYDWSNISKEDTILLLHFDGRTYKDSSIYNCTTEHSDTYEAGDETLYWLTDAEHKFGDAAWRMWDYSYSDSIALYDLSNSNWKFGDTDFTIDFWIKRNGNDPLWINDSKGYIWGLQGNSGGGFQSNISYGKIYITAPTFIQTYDFDIYTPTPDDNEWHHFAYVWDKKSKLIQFYLDGKKADYRQQCDLEQLDTELRKKIYVGGHYEGYYMYSFGGFLDEFRITKKKVWEKDFIPPTKQYNFI